MPVSKKKPTTLTSEGSTQESSSPVLPEQEAFRQYLRRLAVSAIQVLIEHVMCEELEQCIGASWGECTPKRRGYRNGSYTRALVTPTGRIEDLKVPRDRVGAFHTQVFELCWLLGISDLKSGFSQNLKGEIDPVLPIYPL